MRHVSEKTLDLFRRVGKCELCSHWCPRREAAHVIAKGQGGGRRLDIPLNLLGLGPAWSCLCHTRQHSGKIDPQQVFEAVAHRECLDWRFVERQLWFLARAPKDCSPCPRCLGAGSIKVPRGGRTLVWSRYTCPCGGVGIVGPDGEPWVEKERKFSWQS